MTPEAFIASQLAAIDEALSNIAALGPLPRKGGHTAKDPYAAAVAQALLEIAQANSALDREEAAQLAEVAATLCESLSHPAPAEPGSVQVRAPQGLPPNIHDRIWAYLGAALAILAGEGNDSTAQPRTTALIQEGHALARSLATGVPSADEVAAMFAMTSEERTLFGLDDVPNISEEDLDPTLIGQDGHPREDPLYFFIAESRDRLTTLSRDLAALRLNPVDPDLQGEVRRAYHTIKGSAALLGLPGLERIAKALQFLIDERRERGRFDRQIVDLLDQGCHIITTWIDGLDATWVGDPARTVDGQEELEQRIADAKARSGGRGNTGGLSTRPTMLAGVSHNLYSAYVMRLPQDLRTLHSALMILRQTPGDPGATAEARRALHGLKSRSSMIQILPLVKVAGEAEELLEAVAHETEIARTTALIDLIIQAEGIFYETQRLLHEETFDTHYPALSDLAVAMCRSMRGVLEHWWNTGEGATREQAHPAPPTGEKPASAPTPSTLAEPDRQPKPTPASEHQGIQPPLPAPASQDERPGGVPSQSPGPVDARPAVPPRLALPPSGRLAAPAALPADAPPQRADTGAPGVARSQGALTRTPVAGTDSAPAITILDAEAVPGAVCRTPTAASTPVTEERVPDPAPERAVSPRESQAHDAAGSDLPKAHPNPTHRRAPTRASRAPDTRRPESRTRRKQALSQPTVATVSVGKGLADRTAPSDGHHSSPTPTPIDPWLPPPPRTPPAGEPTPARGYTTSPLRPGQSPGTAVGAPTSRARAGDGEIGMSALESPLDRLAALEALGGRSQSLLARAAELAAQERRNIERLDAMVVRLLLEREALRRRNRLLRERLSPRDGDPGAWDELEIESYDSIDQTMVQLQEIVADGRGLSGELRATLELTHATTRRQVSHTASARDELLAMRMVTLQAQYERLDQVVMATASRMGRQVRFVMDADVLLDREVAAALEVPLQHMVRNSVYHGVEDPADRRHAGKNPSATVWVRAFAEHAGLRIEVHDDGRGIDLERVVAVAVGKGIIDPSQAATLSREERTRLIFASGISTADRVSDLAGRGIGMDAVLAAVRAARGDLDVQSEPGRGTAIILRVPRSLAHALVVSVRQNDHELAIPFEQVHDSHEVRPSDLVPVGQGRAFAIGKREVHQRGGDSLLVPVHETCLLEPVPQEESSATLTLLEVRTTPTSADAGSVGILVSEVLDVEMALIEPVPALLRGVDSVLGFLPTAAGRARPLVDAARIIAAARERPGAPTGHAPGTSSLPMRRSKPTVLVVDDSTSVRRYLGNLFAGAGYQVREAPGGVEALQDIARRGRPDLITLDVEMPGMDGMETLNALRQTHGTALPIFMITSRAQDRHREAARELGATRYFNKPFNADEVLGAAALAIEAGQSGAVA